MPSAIPEGTDADLQEQREVVEPDDGGGLDARALTSDPEAPEADAIEQAQTLPLPDEDLDGG